MSYNEGYIEELTDSTHYDRLNPVVGMMIFGILGLLCTLYVLYDINW